MSMRSHFVALSFTFAIGGCASSFKSPALELKNYVSLDLEYAPYQKLYSQLLNTKGPLKTRGEAHLTIVTPPEFKALLKYYKAEEIHAQAQTFLANPPKFKNICLGKGHKILEDRDESTYFMVVEAAGVLAFRQKLAQEKLIPAKDFDPKMYFPHVTLGFTKRDLHYEDGIVKDRTSCLKEIYVNP